MIAQGYTPQLLASGQLASSKGTLYTVPDGFRVIIDQLLYFNTTGGALVCATHIDSGTSRQIDSVSVGATTRQTIVDHDNPLYLDSGDLLEGNAASATSVNYFVFGQVKRKS